MPVYVPHRQRSARSVKTTYIVFQAAQNLPHDEMPKLSLQPDDPLLRWMEDLYAMNKVGALDGDTTKSGLLLACIAHIHGLVERDRRMAHLHPALERALGWLASHYVEPIGPQWLAKHAGVSVSHLNLLFRSEVEHSPMQHVEMLRIERACQVLREPHVRANEAAEACGYADFNYFVRVFKRRMGLPPARWQKQFGVIDQLSTPR